MATVNLQNNPDVAITGTRDADAVIITSEIVTPDLVNYQIEKIVDGSVSSINSDGTAIEGGNIVDVNGTTLKIILEFRTKYRVRTKAQFSNTWGDWVNFTTRDKRYQSPESITQLTDDTDSTAQTQGTKIISGVNVAQGGSRTIVVTNNSKSTETDDSAVGYNVSRNWGNTTVINADTIFADGQLQRTGTVTIQDGSQVSVQAPVQFTARGATVINVPAGLDAPITFTNRGATVNTIRS